MNVIARTAVLAPTLREQTSVATLEAKWGAAEKELRAKFPRAPEALWTELKGLTIHGERHRVLEASDPHVHAYLLAQLFALSVMDTINQHVGLVPVHARLGCVGDMPGISLNVQGLEHIDLKAVEQDFLDHLASEQRKFYAVSLLQ